LRRKSEHERAAYEADNSKKKIKSSKGMSETLKEGHN
jgi:hypothetical protein